MTDSDDELLKLEVAASNSIDGNLRGLALKAAARIRELEAERDEPVTQMIQAKVANKGVADGTHVIVPVKPTQKMIEAGWNAHDGELMDEIDVVDFYCAMIRAAQEN